MQQLKQILNQNLKDSDAKVAYQLSDGAMGLHDIEKYVEIKSSSIYKLWKNWARMGLGEFIPVKGGERFKRAFDLEEIGIDVELPDTKSDKAKSEQTKPNESGSLNGVKVQNETTPQTDNQQTSTGS